MFVNRINNLAELYRLQLSVGCGQSVCENPFCRTSSSLAVSEREAALAVNKKPYLCTTSTLPTKRSIEPSTPTPPDSPHISFLHTLIQHSPLTTKQTSLQSLLPASIVDFLTKSRGFHSNGLPDWPVVLETVKSLGSDLEILEIGNRLTFLLETPTVLPVLALLLQIVLFLSNSSNSPNSLQTSRLVSKFLASIANLPTEPSDALSLWIENLNETPFSSLVSTLISFLTAYLPKISNLDQISDPIRGCCRLLELLFLSNASKRRVALEAFHLSCLSSRIDLKDDYCRWTEGTGTFHFVAHPFLLDMITKTRLMRTHSFLIMAEQVEIALFQASFRQLLSPLPISEIPSSVHLVLEIEREDLHKIAGQLANITPNALKKPLKVRFLGEEGLDQGGLQKEFFQLLFRTFLSEQNYWTENSTTRFVWFNRLETQMENYVLIGTLLGLAVHNGVLLDLHFPPVFYKLLLDLPVGVEDLKTFDPISYASLTKLLDYEGDVEDFCLDFTFSEPSKDGVKVWPLITNGASTPVTKENRQQFVQLWSEFVLSTSITKPLHSLLDGFFSVIDQKALELFHHDELEQLFCGSTELDWAALEAITTYQDYTPSSPVVRWFWEIVTEFDLAHRKLLLSFVTGSDRVPLGGLSSISFRLQRAGPDQDGLPTSRTCFGILLLPQYASKEKLKRLLTIAVANSEGFGLI